MRNEQTQVVKAPREQVFKTWTDYEAWPRFATTTFFSTFFTRVKVVERAGNTVHLDQEIKVMGLKAKRTEKHTLTPPEQIQVEGKAMGSTNTTLWMFEPVPGATQMTAVVETQLIGVAKVFGPLFRRYLQAALSEWMQAFAKYVEVQKTEP